MYLLKLSPTTRSGKSILGDQTVYWYPIKVCDEMFTSVTIIDRGQHETLKSKWVEDGRTIVSFNIDGYTVCIYSGTVGDKRVIPLFNEKPFLVKDGNICYFIPNDELFNDIFYKVDDYIRNIQFSKRFKLDKKLYSNFQRASTDVEKCKIFFEDYFQPGWTVELTSIETDVCAFCTRDIGLNPVLNLISIMPADMWENKYQKELFIYILKNGFLMNWIEVKQIDDAKLKIELKDTYTNITKEKLSDTELNNIIKSIINNLFYKGGIFHTLYKTAASASDESSVNLFDLLFCLMPEEEIKYIDFPRVQPKVIINGIEFHFIQYAKKDKEIEDMKNELKKEKIFDKELEVYKLGKADVNKGFFRYRFIGKIGIAQDYVYLPRTIRCISNAIKNIAKGRNLHQEGEEMWIRRIKIKIITPPQFEHDVWQAFGRIHPLIPYPIDKPSIRIEEEKKLGILDAEIICDYKVYNCGIYIFAKKFNYDFQRKYARLNKLLNQKGITEFGLRSQP